MEKVEAREERGAAVSREVEGKIHASSRKFQARVTASLNAINEAISKGRVGVSFSGGKDSIVLLHLIRSVIPDAPAAIFDSGCEMDETLQLAAHYGVKIIRPRVTYPDMARYSGWWGYPNPVDAGCPFNVKSILIDEPSVSFIVRDRLSVCAMGLRAEESYGRRMNAYTRGNLYFGEDRTWYLCPLAFWTVEDVWAYIYKNNLRYHSAYDIMESMGIHRKQQRLGMALGSIALEQGRVSVLRRIDPKLFSRLALEFPKLRDAS